MKKFILAAIALLTAVVPGLCADMTTVWDAIKQTPTFIVADIPAQTAARNGFETLATALNSAPTSQDINAARRLLATIDEKERLASVSQQGVNVSIYVAPASADLSLYKILIGIDKNDSDDKTLIVLYGTSTKDNLGKVVQNLSIEDLIGG